MFDKIISKLEILEKETIENISNLFEEKVDLNFELPIEISFIERFEIAINKKISSMINSILHDCYINYNCLISK